MPVDLREGYKEFKEQVKSYKAYKELKDQYDALSKTKGNSFEKKKSSVSSQLSSAKKKTKAFQAKAKSQFEELLDVAKIVGEKNTNNVSVLKNLLIKSLKKIIPEIDKILIEEALNLLGCDEQQTYDPATPLYIKVKSVDFRGSLKLEPDSEVGKIFYEKNPIAIQSKPFSMNRELYERIQSGQPYLSDYGQYYKGASGQNLFDIQYVDVNPLNNVGGGWFKITLQNRVNNVNKVSTFLLDYYKSIKLFEFVTLMANIMDSLSGAITFKANLGIKNTEDVTTFSLFIQRILGLCFDSAKEIETSGIAKLSETDNFDESFFQLDEIDLREIESKVDYIRRGVVVFEDCDNVELPVDSDSILESLNDMLFIEDDNDLDTSANNLTKILPNNPKWGGYALDANLQLAIDFDFIKLICDGLIRTILSPKIMLPIITMLKAIYGAGIQFITDSIESYVDFCKKFSSFVIKLISRIGALFVKELTRLIEKDLFLIVRSISRDVSTEKQSTFILIINSLVEIYLALLYASQVLDDWRRCKSVLDEILKALSLVSNKLDIPAFLLTLSEFLDGYSEVRAFLGTIEEMQKLGIPTGTMPDGGPNLDLLSKYSQLRAHNKEKAKNGKVIALSKGTFVKPWGAIAPIKVYGKSV